MHAPIYWKRIMLGKKEEKMCRKTIASYVTLLKNVGFEFWQWFWNLPKVVNFIAYERNKIKYLIKSNTDGAVQCWRNRDFSTHGSVSDFKITSDHSVPAFIARKSQLIHEVTAVFSAWNEEGLSGKRKLFM